MDLTWYTSIGGIVAATIVLVEILKRFLGNTPFIMKVPTWVYAVIIAVVLTEVAHAGFNTLPGDDLPLLMQAVMLAAVASGFREWVGNVNKPLSASAAARTARGENLP